MNAIALISVINHYHIYGLHLFWDTLYHQTQNNWPNISKNSSPSVENYFLAKSRNKTYSHKYHYTKKLAQPPHIPQMQNDLNDSKVGEEIT